MNVYGEEHDVQSHMFRPTITDMQDRFVVTATIFTVFRANIQRCWPLVATTSAVGRAVGRATSSLVSIILDLNRVNIVTLTTLLVLHVGNGRSKHV